MWRCPLTLPEPKLRDERQIWVTKQQMQKTSKFIKALTYLYWFITFWTDIPTLDSSINGPTDGYRRIFVKPHSIDCTSMTWKRLLAYWVYIQSVILLTIHSFLKTKKLYLDTFWEQRHCWHPRQQRVCLCRTRRVGCCHKIPGRPIHPDRGQGMSLAKPKKIISISN